MKEDCPYQRIEYLEVSEEGGFAYIDTEIILKGSNYYMEFDIAINGRKGGNPNIVGNFYNEMPSGEQMYGIVYAGGNNDGAVVFYFGSIQWVVSPFTRYERINFLFDGPKRYCYFGDGEQIGIYREDGVETNSPIRIFSPDQDVKVFAKIYNLKISDLNRLLMDLIPVRVGDEGFMYDRVSGKLFGNAGTGRFILGPDINL